LIFKMARRGGTTPKDGPLVVETFKENGWWISRIDSVPMLQLSDFPWQQKGIWCGLSYTTGIVAKIADFEYIYICHSMRGLKY
jgi:hypothetical protein